MHVYRLVTAATVEENILRKAEQKRMLGHLAIEDGHFTTSYLRGVCWKKNFLLIIFFIISLPRLVFGFTN